MWAKLFAGRCSSIFLQYVSVKTLTFLCYLGSHFLFMILFWWQLVEFLGYGIDWLESFYSHKKTHTHIKCHEWDLNLRLQCSRSAHLRLRKQKGLQFLCCAVWWKKISWLTYRILLYPKVTNIHFCTATIRRRSKHAKIYLSVESYILWIVVGTEMLLQEHQKKGKLQILTQNVYLLVVYVSKLPVT